METQSSFYSRTEEDSVLQTCSSVGRYAATISSALQQAVPR